MKKFFRILLWLLVILLLLLAWPAWQFFGELRKAASEDPLVWEEDVTALESGTRGKCEPLECVVFIGSSSIRFWDTLEQDMLPIPVIGHGFGGAKLNDVVHYAHRLVTAYQPQAVVVFAGTNDIDPAASKSPEQLLRSYQDFVARVRAEQAHLPVFFIAITPSPMRWSVWPIAQDTNALIAHWSADDPNLHVIDTAPVLLGENGEPRRDNYIIDGLHLSERGYAQWTGMIRPVLLQQLQQPGATDD